MLFQEIIDMVNKNDLGIDLRTAAYMSSIQKIAIHYADGGMVFAWGARKSTRVLWTLKLMRLLLAIGNPA